MTEESKKDQLLKRVQVVLAILTAVIGLVVGVYNMKKTVFVQTKPGDIVLQARSAEGKVLGGTRIEVYNSQNALIATSETDPLGAYEIKALEPGTYNVKLAKSGFEPQVATVQVTSGKSANFNISLYPLSAGQKNQIQSALEEAGASWIKNITKAPAPEASPKN